MSIQTDLAYADIALRQAELRREASESRLGRRVQGRRSLLRRIPRPRSHRPDKTGSTSTDA